MGSPRKILIAAAPTLAAIIAEQFAALGRFAVQIASSAKVLGLAEPWPDVIVLDEFGETAETLEGLRRNGFTGAFILLSNDGKPRPGVAATLARPFRFAELVACVEAARPCAPARARPPAGVRLTEKEAAIFARLAQAHGATVSKSALLSEVWGYGPNVSTRTLETHVHRLRRKIETDPTRPRLLLTDGGGYRLAPEGTGESGAVLPER